jgi:hypothetical protein
MIYSSDESKMWDSSHRQNRGAHQIEETVAVAWDGGGARPRKVFFSEEESGWNSARTLDSGKQEKKNRKRRNEEGNNQAC